MSIAELMMQGFELLLLGMGIVFVFLVILVLAMTGMSRLARALEGDPQPLPSSLGATMAGAETSETLLAVIAAAVRQYRSKHQ